MMRRWLAAALCAGVMMAAVATGVAAGEAEWKALQDRVVPLLMSGDLKQAERCGRDAVAEAEKTYGATHLNTVMSQSSLALVLHYEEREAESEKLYRKALAVRIRQQGPMHPATGLLLLNLGDVVQAQGRLPEAEKLQRDALAVFEKIVGDDARTAAALNNLGANLQRQRRYPEAETLLRRALAMKEKVLGSASASVANTLNNLAAVCEALGRKDEAASLRKRMEEIRRNATLKA